MTKDHKPDEEKEFEWIKRYGGGLYKRPTEGGIEFPIRVNPGWLAISRAFGNAEVKLERLGGKPGVVIA